MHAEVEILAAIVRIFPNGTHGDPYNWAVVARGRGKDEVELMGLSRVQVKPSEFRAIREALQAHGITKAVFYRHRTDGTVDERRVK